jgi:hypothetical protein
MGLMSTFRSPTYLHLAAILYVPLSFERAGRSWAVDWRPLTAIWRALLEVVR